jgi:hypothetical protein
MRPVVKIALAAGGAAAVGLVLKKWVIPEAEEPRYSVEEVFDGFEVRRYAPRVVAETTVEGSFKDSLNEGFHRLASYIFGANRAERRIEMTTPVGHRRDHEKIPMTAPVGFTGEHSHHVVSFTMPAKFTMDSLPRPVDERIYLHHVPERRVAVMRFSGRADESVTAEKRRELLGRLAHQDLVPDGEPVLAQFDPPWKPAFMRRNEIQIDLADRDIARA